MRPKRATQGYGFIPSVLITGALLYVGLYIGEHVGVVEAQKALENQLTQAPQ
jgi:hypothetical protein